MDWHSGDWSPMHRVHGHMQPPWFDACERDRPGVYRLVALAGDDDFTPSPLNRVCGTDPTGTIYVGASRVVRNRLGRLWYQQNVNVGRAHKPLPAALSKAFPFGRLAFCWEYVAVGGDPFAREHQLITAYKALFGETPPLNGQG